MNKFTKVLNSVFKDDSNYIQLVIVNLSSLLFFGLLYSFSTNNIIPDRELSAFFVMLITGYLLFLTKDFSIEFFKSLKKNWLA